MNRSSDSALGAAANDLTLDGGTLQPAAYGLLVLVTITGFFACLRRRRTR